MAERGFTVPIRLDEQFYIEKCIECGVRFGMPEDFRDRRREDHRSFYCPNGHDQHYTAESDAEKYRRERDRLAQENARLDEERLAAERRAAAERQERERLQKRVTAGVCPCCQRTFSQLARHMQTKHPDVPFVPAAKPARRRTQ